MAYIPDVTAALERAKTLHMQNDAKPRLFVFMKTRFRRVKSSKAKIVCIRIDNALVL